MDDFWDGRGDWRFHVQDRSRQDNHDTTSSLLDILMHWEIQDEASSRTLFLPHSFSAPTNSTCSLRALFRSVFVWAAMSYREVTKWQTFLPAIPKLQIQVAGDITGQISQVAKLTSLIVANIIASAGTAPSKSNRKFSPLKDVIPLAA